MIKKTENIKYFGIVFDQHLKWDLLVNNLITKMYKLDCFYLNPRKLLDKQKLCMVYFIMTQSILQYDNKLGAT